MDDSTAISSLYDLFNGALILGVKISFIVVIAAAVGAFLAGVFRVVTQIDDPVISLFGKLSCLVVLLYFSFSSFAGDISNFANQVWGDSTYYH